jgi:nitrate reductase delta subunit
MNVSACCAWLAPLLRYPDRGVRDTFAAAAAHLAGLAAATEALSQFATETATLTLADLQELYTRTFDLNPVCPLEIGWHLYGEQYERGAFMVRMREALQEHGIDPAGELPDHLSCALSLAAGAARDPVPAGVEEAVRVLPQMIAALDAATNPYRHLFRAIAAVMAGALAEVSHA